MADDYVKQIAEHLRKKKEDDALETKKNLLEQELKRSGGPKYFHELREFLARIIKDTNEAVGERILEFEGAPAVETLIIKTSSHYRKNSIEVSLDPSMASIKYALRIGYSNSVGYFSAQVSNAQLQ